MLRLLLIHGVRPGICLRRHAPSRFGSHDVSKHDLPDAIAESRCSCTVRSGTKRVAMVRAPRKAGSDCNMLRPQSRRPSRTGCMQPCKADNTHKYYVLQAWLRLR